RFLGEFHVRLVFGQRAVNLIRADLKKPLDRIGLGGIQKHLCSNDVGLNEWPGAEDAAIDVRLGGKMHHMGDAVLFEKLSNEWLVADVAAQECQARILHQVLEIGQIPGVGELIERNDFGLLPAADEHPYKIRADEAGAGDENVH